jgi:hypothetical protein
MWSIVEERTTAVPGFDAAWLPAAAFRYVTPLVGRSGDRVELKAGTYAGVIPLANGETLRITPKAGAHALGRMILVTEGLDRTVASEFTATAELGRDDEEDGVSWLRLLARSYANELRGIETRSLRRERIEVDRRLDHARGRLDVLATVQSLARREAAPVHCTFKVPTADTPANHLLGVAARRILGVLDRDTPEWRVAVRWAERFGSGGLDRRMLSTIVAGLRTNRFSGSRGYYVRALVMAHLLLSDAGLSLNSDEVVPGEALLVNTADLFERYVRTLIARAVTDDGLVATKGATPTRTLLTDGTCETTPDVVISDGRGPCFLVDAKYKTSAEVPASDFYQLYAYLRVFDVGTGAFVLPALDGDRSVTRRATSDGCVLLEVRIPLGDWRATEAWLGPTLRQAIRESRTSFPPASSGVAARS